jgi:hypothetical protein
METNETITIKESLIPTMGKIVVVINVVLVVRLDDS